MTLVKRVVAGLVAALAVNLYVSAAHAAPDCAQPPVVVPGLSGPPVWLPPTPGSTAWRAQLQDPRWAGGPVYTFGDVVGGAAADQFDAQYRFVYQGNKLFVSIQVLVDSDGIDGTDAAYFGITDGTGAAGAHLFEMPLDTGDPPSPCASVVNDLSTGGHCPIPTSTGLINYYQTLNRAAATPVWTLQSAPPAWLQNVATWPGATGVVWAVTLEIDLSATAIAGPINMFFGVRIGEAGATTVLLANAGGPGGAVAPVAPGLPAGAVAANWASFSALGTACPVGIAISMNSVGVLSGGTLTNAVNTCPGSTCTNTFRVEAQNVPAGASPFDLRTRIRVADWGATIADPNAPWIDFGIPADVFVKPAAYFTNPPWVWTQTGGTVDVDYTCALDGVAGHTFCPWLPNAVASGQQHQCMLVEISPSPGAMGTPGYNIQTPAVYRNMEFGTLSALQQPATISLKGLQKITKEAADRDVYLYVETTNMPPAGRAPIEIAQKPLEAARAYALHPPPIPRVNRDVAVQAAAAAPPGLLDLPLLTADQALRQVYPTYRVFAYYDSGKTIAVKGSARKVLVPMVPFGFYLNHQGQFYGFTNSLEFLDKTAQQIAPNFYVIRVNNEGEAHVRTNVSAEEKPYEPPPPPPVRCTCDIVRTSGWSFEGLGLAGLAVALFAMRLRRRSR